jgi:hypothetical protein
MKPERPPTRVDLLDGSGAELISVAVSHDEGRLILGNSYYVFYDASLFLDPFETRYSQQTYFYPDGSRRAQGIHDQGQKHGPWTYYHHNGAKSEEGRYAWGRKVGQWTQWDENSNMISQFDFGP